MAKNQITVYPDGEGVFDSLLIGCAREVVIAAISDMDPPTIAGFMKRLGIGSRRAYTLIDEFDLRGHFRKYERKPQ